MKQVTVVILIVVVSALAMVQMPLDFQTHRLSRRATTQAGTTVGIVIAIDAYVSRAFTVLAISIGITILVSCLYGLANWMSPQSLGWGDVLLVAPLTLTISYVDISLIPWWQFAAATTAAIHGLWTRLKNGTSYIPFGPHILASTLLFLTFALIGVPQR